MDVEHRVRRFIMDGGDLTTGRSWCITIEAGKVDIRRDEHADGMSFNLGDVPRFIADIKAVANLAQPGFTSLAASEGMTWHGHPLTELSDDDLKLALSDVYESRETFMCSYDKDLQEVAAEVARRKAQVEA